MTIDQESAYFKTTMVAFEKWQLSMCKKPTILNGITKSIQIKINHIIPEKVHIAITKAVKGLTKAVIFGAGITTSTPAKGKHIEEIENNILKRIHFYSSSAAAEGAITGFGGFFSSLADFPLWLTLKMKMIFEIASHYEIDINDYTERIYILYIFQLAFSSQQHRNIIYTQMQGWDGKKENLPNDIHEFDWRTFQLEYRDHIDLAKLIQMIPGIGAFAGAYINHRLTKRLGNTAMNAYRMRFSEFSKN
ncbi:MAG: EcsC family protein [Cyclobacteriaceae bacterium]|nr:EcsC family protein [Cyclobacteriaceae bacterium]